MLANASHAGVGALIEHLEARQLLAVQVYDGPLNDKIVFTSGGHGWQYNSGLGRYATDRPDYNDIVEDFGNQDQMSFLADYVLRAGGTVVPMRPVGHQLNEVVLDNDSAGVTFSGSWSNSTSTHRYDEDYGAVADAVAYRFATTTSGAETAVATYQPTIPQAGLYPVYTWVLDSSNRTDQLYRINHTGGTTEIRVDHRRVGKGWVYLGTYHFGQGSNPNGNVQISNNASVAGNVIADAIRFGNGMGDFVDTGAPGPSGYPREDENSYHWIRRALGTGVTVGGSIGTTSNVSAPSEMAEWMYNGPFGGAVYIGFHSNGTTGNPATATARGAIGLIDSDQGTPNQSSLALYTGRQINQDMQALNGTFEHNWSTRTSHSSSGGFGEIDLGAGAEMDATIIEVGFHDTTLDADMLKDPRVRDQLGRSTYEAALEYFDVFGGLTAPVSQPDQPGSVRAVANANGSITLFWTPPTARSGGPAAATGYRIYQSRDGYGFGDPIQVGSGVTSYTIPAGNLDSDAYYFKIAGFNAGGEGPGSAVAGARKNGTGGGTNGSRILIVNGFDRLDRSTNERYPYAYTSNNDDIVDRVRLRYNNTFDYIVQAGEAIETYTTGGASLGFDTAQNEHIINGAVNLNNYHTVIWLSGEESTADETFSSTEQSLVGNFLNAGGRLFVSGSEIGWDLDRASGPTAGDRAFYNDHLRADHPVPPINGDDANTYTTVAASGGIFAGMSSIVFDNGSNYYDAEFPDVLLPVGGAIAALNYSGGTGGVAAIQYDGGANGPKVVNFGFPFETITNITRRNNVMQRVLNFFGTAVTASAAPGTPDLAAGSDTGVSSSDNLTNRDNSNAGKTLQFSVGGTISGATVRIYDGANLIGSAVASGTTTTVTTNGTFDLSDGAHSITATQQEPGSDESPASSGLSITIDTAAPAAPSVPDLSAGSDTGNSSTDNLTNDTTPTFTGTGEASASALYRLYADGVLVGSQTSGSGSYNITSSARPDGTESFTATLEDAAGNVSVASGGLSVTIDTVAPVVTGAFVSGSGWTSSFKNFLQSSGQGDATFGYRLDAANHADELPWTNLNTVSFRFDSSVAAGLSSFNAYGINTPAYGMSAFAYDAASNTATFSFSAVIANDKILLALSSGSVADLAGNALDGEWTNPASSPSTPGGADTFPSGNGAAGGDFEFRINVLPGDVNRSGGSVLGSDVTLTRNAQNSTPGGAGSLYTIFKDVNGSGSILGSDVTLVRNRQGLSLPAGEPTTSSALTAVSAMPSKGNGKFKNATLAFSTTLIEDRDRDALKDLSGLMA